MANGTFEPEQTELVRKLLNDSNLFINIGANMGYYCCHALSMGCPVIAFEPFSLNVHYLMRNIRENGWAKQAEIFPLAVGPKTGIVNIWGSGTGASLIKGWDSISENYVTQVPVMSLDRLLGHKINGRRTLIVVDIEGAEFMMLQGAKSILRNDPAATWIVEINSTEHQPKGTKINPNFAKTFGLFFAEGYQVHAIDENLSKISLEEIEAIGTGQVAAKVSNYLFCK